MLDRAGHLSQEEKRADRLQSDSEELASLCLHPVHKQGIAYHCFALLEKKFGRSEVKKNRSTSQAPYIA